MRPSPKSRRRCKPCPDRPGAFEAEGRGDATLRGYNDSWASHKYRERFGAWPNDPRVRYARPALLSLTTKNWLVSRQIAFAKTRASHG
jgi:DNA repair protein RadD